jgi:hypothetical protein
MENELRQKTRDIQRTAKYFDLDKQIEFANHLEGVSAIEKRKAQKAFN